MSGFLLVFGMMCVTFIPRVLPMLLANRLNLPKSIEQALNYVPIAVLTIIVVQSSLYQQGEFQFTLKNPYLWAVIASAGLAKIQKSLLLTIVVGMAVYGVLRFWLFTI